ncbi:MAG: nuclear transport factor 2 family protein [Proteobacteria bacterium]|nr:nuclear transport factor 2 family protein [Pseudomonadota bacterium]
MPHSTPTLALALVLAALAPAAAPAAPAAAAADTEREIARLEQDCNDAYGRNDLERYFAFYADNAVLIFYNERTTMPAYRKMWSESIHAGNGVAAWRLTDLVVRVGPAGDVAVASYHVDAANHYADGHDTHEQGYETDVWVRRHGRWRIEHVQYSLALPPPS